MSRAVRVGGPGLQARSVRRQRGNSGQVSDESAASDSMGMWRRRWGGEEWEAARWYWVRRAQAHARTRLQASNRAMMRKPTSLARAVASRPDRQDQGFWLHNCGSRPILLEVCHCFRPKNSLLRPADVPARCARRSRSAWNAHRASGWWPLRSATSLHRASDLRRMYCRGSGVCFDG